MLKFIFLGGLNNSLLKWYKHLTINEENTTKKTAKQTFIACHFFFTLNKANAAISIVIFHLSKCSYLLWLYYAESEGCHTVHIQTILHYTDHVTGNKNSCSCLIVSFCLLSIAVIVSNEEKKL